ncbi:MAG: putative zinc-binding peptidase [Xanthobacteraceae bacterium]
MKLFQCQNCGQPLYFENTRCERCGLSLGYLHDRETITALETRQRAGHPEQSAWPALTDGKRYRFCANAEYDVCNWLIPAASSDAYCAACRHNQMIPNLSLPENLIRWRALEAAKHRLFYTLFQLRLPVETQAESPAGLAFEFLADVGPAASPIMTGHTDGVITINLAEADDAERERQRQQMGELYRTLLGHFRHEIGHYYWDRLIADTPHLEEFRRIFGDERRDYAAALQTYYANGAPADWSEHFISAYASSHPWEDFAETWAHYFHMVDTLETAHVAGLAAIPQPPQNPGAVFDFHPHDTDMKRLVEAWLALTFAVNSVNRSMGLHDLYPFVLGPLAVAKLTFVQERIRAVTSRKPETRGSRPPGAKGGLLRRLRSESM